MEEDVHEALTIFTAECQSILPQVHTIRKRISDAGDLDPSTSSNAFLKTWEKFSQIHHSSPSRLNNNISNRNRRRPPPDHDRSPCKLNGQKEEEPKAIGPGQLNISTTVIIIRQGLFYGYAILLKALELLFMLIASLIIFYGVIVLHRPTQAFISRNTQDLIYPVMRGLRIFTLPIIRTFPRLTEIYEESCLITNPAYFSMNKVECWPCEEAKQVIDLTGFSNFSSVYYYGGIPFLVKIPRASESQTSLMERIYLENEELLSSVELVSNVNGIRTFQDVFPTNHIQIFDQHENLHIAWKINKVSHTRVLRKYFSKPSFIPAKTEVSIQHFLFLDNFNSPPYALPFTEFANVFLHQAGGSRHVVLIPTETCQKTCKVLSVVLQHGDVLFYNWLYWRPRSVPLKSSSLYTRDTNHCPSVTYLGSFY